ncbi:MAG: M23 family metallopeptidase [Bacteroidia bacterium]|jgi:murein DD-endopeptidase MepM/ murein hydrolase activator NlpD|nr:M23 family metallopeptidase [Bacteroidia bacterium]
MLKTYRVELIDDLTLSQSRQLILKPITVVAGAALLFFGIVVGTIALVMVTPAFHRMIPGFEEQDQFRREKKEMTEQLQHMELQIEQWSALLSSFKKLAGVEDDSLRLDQTRLDSLLQVRATTPMAEGGAPAEEAPASVSTPAASVAPAPAVKVVYVPAAGESVRKGETSVLDRLYSPVDGSIRNPYSITNRHYGIDIAAPAGSMIRSVASGVVILAEYSEQNGWVIGVASGDNTIAFYKHNSRLLKTAGSFVTAGEPLAVIGNTGENSSGMHLHLELWRNGRPVDPAPFLSLTSSLN